MLQSEPVSTHFSNQQPYAHVQKMLSSLGNEGKLGLILFSCQCKAGESTLKVNEVTPP